MSGLSDFKHVKIIHKPACFTKFKCSTGKVFYKLNGLSGFTT
jgi:hypothetical protein